MAKRFTDTEKWDDPWFMELRPDLKLIWIYLIDNCDHAGIWKVNGRIAEMRLGFKPNLDEALEVFAGRVFRSADGLDWFVPKFLRFQYGFDLSNGSAVESAIRSIKQKGFEKVAAEFLGDNYVSKSVDNKGGGTPPPLSPHSPGGVQAKAMAKASLFSKGEGGGGEGAESPLQKTVRGWKILNGIPTEGPASKAWDKVHFSRHARAASQLINLFGGVQGALDCMEFVWDELKQKDLSVTIETVVKHSDLYREHLAGSGR